MHDLQDVKAAHLPHIRKYGRLVRTPEAGTEVLTSLVPLAVSFPCFAKADPWDSAGIDQLRLPPQAENKQRY